MKVLIIYAHPREKSFNQAILKRAESVLAELRQNVKIRDLYALGFNPSLSADDQNQLDQGIIPPDIKAEQEFISWAEYIIVIHPIWWFGMPAIMKGYIDRVMISGFAYVYEENQMKGLLDDKKVLLINTTGTPELMMEKKGITKVLQASIDKGIYEFCGMEVEHLFLAGVPYVKRADREDYLDQVENILWKEFN